MLAPVTFNRFGGLLLDRPVDEVGGEAAIEIQDVTWDGTTGAIRPRDGAKKFTVEGATAYTNLFAHSSTIFLTRRGSTLVALTTGEEKKTSASFGETKLSFTHFGTPSAEYTYIADGAHTIRRFDGTNFAEPKAKVDGEAEKAMPKGKFLAAWPDGGNRLVVAGTVESGGPNGKASSKSHVWFSEPGDAEGYESTAFVQLLPGDGEEIRACCVWGGMVFVFKETNLFVFYGVSVDEEGKPEFNFRSIPLGTPLVKAENDSSHSLQPAVAGVDGVYYVTPAGIYLTTGGPPVLISGKVEGLRYRKASTGSEWNLCRGLYYSRGKLFAHVVGAAYVYHTDIDEWTRWQLPTNFVSFAERPGTSTETVLHFVTGGSPKNLFAYEPFKATDESGLTLTPVWRSGFYDLESADEKTLTLMKVWGEGTINVKVAKDFGAVGSATSFTLTSAEGAQKNVSQTGTMFSHQIEGTGAWKVERISRWQREDRYPGIKG